jgi:drug/metabolite transporter (DMT)-like permease
MFDRSHVASGLVLFIYAAPFSFAYVRIGASVGALVLFGAVQLTMIGWGIARGERPARQTWVGLSLSAAGLLTLVMPAATAAPDSAGTALMALAGVAWGIYSLRGRGAVHPLTSNARSFVWSVPCAVLLAAVVHSSSAMTATGVALAAVSGSLTSGLGYAIWYRALRGLTATQAGIAQLSVPVIAALGGVALLGEHVGLRLLVATVGVLGGVALALSAPRRSATR